MKFRNI